MNLFIGNLSPETSEDALRQIFSEFGTVVTVKIPIDNATGLPRGFGFVEMEDKFQAYDAIDNLDTTYLLGNIISVKESKPKTQGNTRPGSGNRPGGGFNRNNNNRQGGGGGSYNRNSSGGSNYTGGRSNYSSDRGERNYNSDNRSERNYNSNQSSYNKPNTDDDDKFNRL